MRQQLIQYVTLLFVGTPNSEEIKQEILQNTLDRYDDLIAQGKTPEAAYRLAISGIGDINEIFATIPKIEASYSQPKPAEPARKNLADGKSLRAIAVGLYILSPVPLIVLTELDLDTLGLCGTLALIAAATIIIILGSKRQEPHQKNVSEQTPTPQKEFRKSIDMLIWAIGIIIYLVLSFATKAWYLTWILFPIIAATQGLINACLDLLEAAKHEN